MTPRLAAELLRTLRENPKTLDEVLSWVTAAGSSWNQAQVLLFLRCIPEITNDGTTLRISADGGEENLKAALLQAVRSFGGKPVPAAMVRARLPGDLVTTDEQVRALAKRTAGLRIVGPGLIQSIDEGREP